MFYDMTWLERVIFLKQKGGGGGTPAHEATSYTGSFFTDMIAPLKKLLVSFVPKQNLNGYEKPWAGGSGKNCIDIDTLFVAPQGTLYSGDTPYTFPHVLELALKSNTTYTVSSDYTIANKQRIVYVDTATAADAVYKANSVVKTTGDDGILKIGFFDNRTGSEEFLNKTVYLQIEEGSTASSYEPYENVCPIEGWTQVGVKHIGKNLIDDTANIWTNNYFIDGSGVMKSSVKYRYTTDLIPIKPNTTYYVQELKTRTTENAVTVPFYDENGEFLTRQAVNNSTTETGIMGGTFTTTADTRYIRISCGRYSENVQLEKGDTRSEYEPYRGRTYTTSLGRTVYGYTLDVVSGELVVDKGFAVFDGTETWTKNTRALNAFYTARPQGCKQSTTMVSNSFTNVKTAQGLYNTYGACFCGLSMNFNVDPETIGGSTIEDWKAWLANNPLQVVYKLATPITYQLTPQQINSLIGQNNIILDDGAEVSEVVYMTHLVGGSLLGGSTSSPNPTEETEEPNEEMEEVEE